MLTAVSHALALMRTGLLNMTVRLATMAENSFNAVERILEYSGAYFTTLSLVAGRIFMRVMCPVLCFAALCRAAS